MPSTESLKAEPIAGWRTPEGIAQTYPITEAQLARMRYKRCGPPFTRVTYKKLLYRVQDVEAWLQRLPVGGDTRVRKANTAKDGGAKKRKISA